MSSASAVALMKCTSSRIDLVGIEREGDFIGEHERLLVLLRDHERHALVGVERVDEGLAIVGDELLLGVARLVDDQRRDPGEDVADLVRVEDIEVPQPRLDALGVLDAGLQRLRAKVRLCEPDRIGGAAGAAASVRRRGPASGAAGPGHGRTTTPHKEKTKNESSLHRVCE